ncbi:MAG: trypsin-like peptidase domain-containing protein [Myxococcales bacterium]
MRFVVVSLAWLTSILAVFAASPAAAQELARVSVSRPLRVGGIVVEPGGQDVIGLSRIKFQGLIASELASVGYRLADAGDGLKSESALAPLTLLGVVKEEICDDEAPSQCRVAIQWELQDPRGVVVYRTTTRAVDQTPSLEKLRRGLVEGALRSLLQRRRFTLQLSDQTAPRPAPVVGPLGFKRCKRPAVALPQAARAAAASLVFVESGSSLAAGAIVSGDGLILTVASTLEANAPLRVRFSAEQTLPARVVALDRKADVALLHVAAHTDATCLVLRDTVLAPGQAVFGVSSELSEDRAFSLSGGAVLAPDPADGEGALRVDPALARAPGAALLDAEGRLAAVVTSRGAHAGGASGRGLGALATLAALELKPAAITDPRLLAEEADKAPAVGYVRDRDDPPFALTKRYTYGTSATAHRLRTAGWITAGVGAVGVVGTWSTFRTIHTLSPTAHNRFVVLNDVSWVLLGLGAVGVGVSYALPQGHDIVGVRSARRTPTGSTAGQLFVRVAAGGDVGGVELELGGRI